MPPTDPPHLEHLTEDERELYRRVIKFNLESPKRRQMSIGPVFLATQLATIAALRASERDLTERVAAIEGIMWSLGTLSSWPLVKLKEVAKAALAAQAKETT